MESSGMHRLMLILKRECDDVCAANAHLTHEHKHHFANEESAKGVSHSNQSIAFRVFMYSKLS